MRRLTRIHAGPGDRCGYRKACQQPVEFDYVVPVKTRSPYRPGARLKRVCGECAAIIQKAYKDIVVEGAS